MSNPLNGTRRALALVELVGRHPAGVSFTQIASDLDIGSASLSRLLKTLLEENWIAQEETASRYVAGTRLLGLGHEVREHNAVPDIVARVVSTLAHEAGHSACFATFQQDFFMLLSKNETGSSYHFIDTFARNYDWRDNAMGLYLLAFQPMETVRKIYQLHFEIDPPAEDLERFQVIRQDQDYVKVDGSVMRIMSPVRNPAGGIDSLVAVAALDPVTVKVTEILGHVKRAAAEAERRLSIGHPSSPRLQVIQKQTA